MPYDVGYLLLLVFCLLGTLWLPAALVTYERGYQEVSYRYVAAFFGTEVVGMLFYFWLVTL